MKYLTKENIILALLVYLFVTSFFSVGDEGDSEIQKMQKATIERQTQTIILEKKLRNQDYIKFKSFKDEVLKNNTGIDNTTNSQVDSLFTAYGF